jgi:hypothetical protein
LHHVKGTEDVDVEDVFEVRDGISFCWGGAGDGCCGDWMFLSIILLFKEGKGREGESRREKG